MKYAVGLVTLIALAGGAYFFWMTQGRGGQSASGRFVKSCIINGDTEEVCDCTAAAMESNMSPESFQKLVSIAEASDNAAGEKFMQDIFAENPEAISDFVSAISSCGSNLR